MLSFDWDAVFFNLGEIVHADIYKKHGIQLTDKDVVHWDFYRENYPESIRIWQIWEKYKEGKLIAGATDFINKISALVNQEQIKIVTSTHPKLCHDSKSKFIKKLTGFDNIIHSSDKYLYTKGTLLIDDNLDNIRKHVDNNINDFGLIFDLGYGWNQEPIENTHDRIFRARSYNEAYVFIENYLKEKGHI